MRLNSEVFAGLSIEGLHNLLVNGVYDFHFSLLQQNMIFLISGKFDIWPQLSLVSLNLALADLH
jgi:hypothetical protein